VTICSLALLHATYVYGTELGGAWRLDLEYEGTSQPRVSFAFFPSHFLVDNWMNGFWIDQGDSTRNNSPPPIEISHSYTTSL
jgi:hypothetical protein